MSDLTPIPPATIHTFVTGTVAKVSIEGRFSFSTHNIFLKVCNELSQNPKITEIVVDLSKTDYVDSCALGMLLILRERAGNSNKKITLTSPSDYVSQVLDIANFYRLFKITK